MPELMKTVGEDGAEHVAIDVEREKAMAITTAYYQSLPWYTKLWRKIRQKSREVFGNYEN